MPKISKILLLTVSVVLVLAIFLGVNSAGVSAASESPNGAYRQIDVYTEVLRHIQTDYVTDPNMTTVTNGALRGLLESLDADSSYLSPADYTAYKADEKADKGDKAQVGINVSKRYGYATVVSVLPGSPADKANLVDGDILEAVDGKDTRNISLAIIKLMMEGKAGSELSVAVVRPNTPVPDKITMTRVVPQVPPVSDTMYENSSILYLKPVVLDHEHVQEIASKLKSMQRSGNKKVLLDLRDVASGNMAEATRLVNFFLKSGTIAMLEGQTVDKQMFVADASKTIDATAPLVVLVNRGTAGPGELVAGALLDNNRAELVGERTFGEGSEQKTFELPDGAALILSVAKYESPSGKKLQDDAVTPEVLVASSLDNADGTQKSSETVDEQLSKALDILKSKSS